MKRVSILLAVLMIAVGAIAQKSKWREANSYLSKGKLDQAKESIDTALKDASLQNEAKAYYTKGEIYQAIAQDPTGLFQKLDENAASMAYEAYMKALELDSKGKLKKKVKINVINLTNALANEGANAFEKENYKGAVDRFEKVLEIQNSDLVKMEGIDTAMMFNVALAAEKAEDYDKAIKYYNEVKEYGYQEAKTYARLSAALKGAGKEDEATKVLEEGAEKYPNDLNIIFELINKNLLGGTPEKAAEYVDKAIELEPNNASLYRAKGSIYEKTGDIEQAKVWYEKAVEMNPDDFASQYNVAVMLLKAVEKRREEVNDIMDQAEYDAAVEDLYDRYAETLPYFEKAHSINPEDVGTIQILKEIYFKLRERSPEMMEKYEKYNAMLQ
ncbi:tetratricopeptide repeat protein [Balneicella halophila]|uniref:Tetratricopeptide repeat protein n=1 Tax=Balneicella halophila TaxID=1537566 RepID=A0A7L4UQ27_BALHA|nr:tetratricopeptide repeat protein [Balneicella halophila]PVX49850.1 tetratricopeptide repeat protein [Balneicella halophila]